MKEFAQRGDRALPRHGPGFVDGRIAEVLDDPRLGDERRADQLLERRFVDARGERRVVRVAQARLVAIEPLHHPFQGEAGVEAGGARIGMREGFRPRRMLVDGGKFGGEEGELRHEKSQTWVR